MLSFGHNGLGFNIMVGMWNIPCQIGVGEFKKHKNITTPRGNTLRVSNLERKKPPRENSLTLSSTLAGAES